MTNDDLCWRIERLCQRAWPALDEECVGGWRLRFAGGFTRRANSANPLSVGTRLDDRVLADIALRYRARGLAPVFRLPSLINPAIDARLSAAGYRLDAESTVLFGARDSWTEAVPDKDVLLRAGPEADWFAAVAHLRAQGPKVAPLFGAIIARLDLPAAFAMVRYEGAVVATAFAVLSDGMLCFEAVVTDPALRGRGFGRRLVNALLAWGAQSGAQGACLQVETGNVPARALYRRAGLTREMYGYRYRCGP